MSDRAEQVARKIAIKWLKANTPPGASWLETLTDAVTAALRSYAGEVVCPPGWKMAPEEPHQAMLDAAEAAWGAPGCLNVVDRIWPAMLAAAPMPPASDGWNFDMEAAPKSDDKMRPIIVAAHVGHDGAAIVGEAYYIDDTEMWWWANQGEGDYHADPIFPRPYAWRELPDAPPPPGQEDGA